MMMDYSIHKGSFLNFIAPNSFFFNFDYSYFSCTRLGNVRNTAGVNHSAAAPLQRSYGVVAVSQKYQNFKNRRRYVIASKIPRLYVKYSQKSTNNKNNLLLMLLYHFVFLECRVYNVQQYVLFSIYRYISKGTEACLSLLH